jgi:membrane protease YdiL (CAAX protease family)
MERRTHGPALASAVSVAFAFILLLSYIWLWQRSFEGHWLLLWLLYAAAGGLGHLARGEHPREIGWTGRAFGRALTGLTPFVLVTVGVAVALGAAAGSLRPPQIDSLGPRLLLGTAWGVAQQYGLVAIFYRGLLQLLPERKARVAAASLFALFHLPNPFLTLFTLGAGWVACTVYRRAPNLWALGLAHAIVSQAVSRSLPQAWTGGMRVGPGFLSFIGAAPL